MEFWRRLSICNNSRGFVKDEEECLSLGKIIVWIETESKAMVQDI